MDLKTLLNGFRLGEKQDAGVMSVIPLLAPDATDNLAAFSDVEFTGTTNYGTMVFKNKSDKPFILPSGYSVITKQAAQDHGSTFAYLLEPDSTRYLSETCCIESSQGGYINGKEVKDFYLLPLYVRKQHFEQNVREGRGKAVELASYDSNFSRLWPIISEFQKGLITDSRSHQSHLVYFFNKFVDRLNEFNAEFETVKGQRGAVILLNDRVVGIEIAPTEAYWKVLWQRLIRDCYGSEVVRLTMNNLIKEFKRQQEQQLALDGCRSIEAIEEAIANHTTRYQTEIGGQLRSLLEKELVALPKTDWATRDNNHSGFAHHVFKVKGEKTYGELYTEGEKTVYASVLF